MVRLVLFDVLDHLDVEDAAYIRETREKQLGVEWHMLREQRDEYRPIFRQQVAPLRLLLRQQPFLSGIAPAYADYSVFSLFQWARMISDYLLFEANDPLQEWHRSMAKIADKIASTIGPGI
jgi:glutathione S-transferase